jgi:hypothetical protein
MSHLSLVWSAPAAMTKRRKSDDPFADFFEWESWAVWLHGDPSTAHALMTPTNRARYFRSVRMRALRRKRAASN